MTDYPVVPHIDVGAPIGGGAFGRVYRGRHRTLDLDIAVKFVNVAGFANADGALQEARLMARLDHPNLLRIFDAGLVDDVLYLVLELMDGTSDRFRPMSGTSAVGLARQLLAGLQSLHAARVLHRDIKPANCLVRARDGRVKLADLGIAVEQSTRSGRSYDLAGTLPFMAPELFEAPPRFSPASDLYAVGRTLQCLLLERDPFPCGSAGAMIAWAQEAPAPRLAEHRPDVPSALSALIERLCARAVGDRPASAEQAVAALSPIVAVGALRPAEDATGRVIGSWVVGPEIQGDRNFYQHAVTHARTGAGGRLAHLRMRCPLASTSPLILASAERASRLSHPGLADVVDWGLHDGRAYVVTRSQGHALQALVESSGPVEEVEALDMVRALADALVYLHDVGLIYQVVNPQFAMISGNARTVQLAWPMFCVPVDSPAAFGGSSLLVQVPLYAAPESIAGPGAPPELPPPAVRTLSAVPRAIGRFEVIAPMGTDETDTAARITTRVDLYGLGEILHYLIAGRPAFPATTEMDALLIAKATRPARLREVVPAVSAPTAQLVAELTEPNPARRPASAAAVRDRLDRIARGLRPAPAGA